MFEKYSDEIEVCVRASGAVFLGEIFQTVGSAAAFGSLKCMGACGGRRWVSVLDTQHNLCLNHQWGDRLSVLLGSSFCFT